MLDHRINWLSYCNDAGKPHACVRQKPSRRHTTSSDVAITLINHFTIHFFKQKMMSTPVPDWVAFSADITPEAAHVFEMAIDNPTRPPEVPDDIDSYEAVAFTSRPVIGSPTDNEYAFFCNNMPAGELGRYTAALVYVHVHEMPFGTHITSFKEVHPPEDLG